jgi:Ser/Thr protein kinase RdoA (MazF antagonist)
MAAARANHPGRFHALVFDAEGRPAAFVKVARDTMGAQALATERDALDGFGADVPPPLLAPELLDHSDGVLVFRAMDWQARTFPWRLPEEVAFAIGTFFRRTSPDGSESGAAHGDFAPWNLLRTESGWGLVDWENFRVQAPPYYDLFHFLVQSHAGLRRPLMRSIVSGLNGEGSVGGIIRAYAAGSEVDARDSAHFLREYLRISAATLGPDYKARGLRARSKISSRVGR